MGKGATGWLIVIFLAVVIVVGIFSLRPGILKTAEDKVQPIEYKNDVITLENYMVTNKAPYGGSTTTIEFDIKNNGDKTISSVEVYFFDLGGFTVEELKCEEANPENNVKCVFKDIDPLDTRSVSLVLKAPSTERLAIERSVSFYVEYGIEGSREAIIPIVDGISKKEPSGKFSQSKPSYGPVILDIKPKLEREIIVEGKNIKEYWGVYGKPFETEFKFNHVGTVGKTEDIIIPQGKVKLKLSGLKPHKDKYCDFVEQDDYWSSNKDVKVPYGSLFCSFIPTEEGLAEYGAVISAEFSYIYRYLIEETFVVQPLP